MHTEEERNLFSVTFTICATFLLFSVVLGLIFSEHNHHKKEIELAKAGLEQTIKENKVVWTKPINNQTKTKTYKKTK